MNRTNGLAIILLLVILISCQASGEKTENAATEIESVEGVSCQMQIASGLDENNKPINNDVEEAQKSPATDQEVLKDISELKKDYLQNLRVVNAVCDNPKNRISVKELPNRLEQFNNHLTQNNELLKTANDYASHFRSWHIKNKVSNTPRRVQYL